MNGLHEALWEARGLSAEGLADAIQVAADEALYTVANGFGGDLSYFDDSEIAVSMEVLRSVLDYCGDLSDEALVAFLRAVAEGESDG